MSTLLKKLIASPATVPMLLLLGAIERIGWVIMQKAPTYALGEASHIAMSLAKNGTYANAFAPDSGPSAHLLPVSPFIAGAVYRLLGSRTPPAEAVLLCWAVAISLLSFWLLFLIFGELGASRRTRLVALAIACLVPLNIQLEAVWFRIWEGALGTSAALAFLWLTIRLDREGATGWRTIGLIAFGAALTFFIAPQLGAACYACAAVLMVRRLPVSRWPAAILASAGALAIFIVPWAIRNQHALGEPVLLRSNFGLELAVGMNPAALGATQPREVFLNRLHEIHPAHTAEALAKFKAAGGELAYSRLLEKRTRAWMMAHPDQAAGLAAQHLSQMLFPPAWFWTDTGGGKIRTGRMLFVWATSALALLWIAAAPWRGRRDFIYPAIMFILPILPYMITQPVSRYRYIVASLALFMACDFCAYAFGRLSSLTKLHRRAPI